MHRPDSTRDDLPAAEGTVTDAEALSPGQRLIYPGQGVCEISGIEVKEIAGQKLEMVRMVRVDDGAAVLVPRGKVQSIGLRRLPTPDQIEGVFHYLGASYDAPELDWKTRHRDNADRLILGGLLGVAEVVKGLHGLSNLRPLPTKEREIYDHARHLLVNEISASVGIPPCVAEDLIDFALIPPVGVKFDLKPPPPPVLPPAKPKPKRAPLADELADLGLGDLDLDEEEEAAEADGEPRTESEDEPPATAEGAAGAPHAHAHAPKAHEKAPPHAPHKAAKGPAKKGVAKKPAKGAKATTPAKHAGKKAAAKKPARGGKKK